MTDTNGMQGVRVITLSIVLCDVTTLQTYYVKQKVKKKKGFLSK